MLEMEFDVHLAGLECGLLCGLGAWATLVEFSSPKAGYGLTKVLVLVGLAVVEGARKCHPKARAEQIKCR